MQAFVFRHGVRVSYKKILLANDIHPTRNGFNWRPRSKAIMLWALSVSPYFLFCMKYQIIYYTHTYIRTHVASTQWRRNHVLRAPNTFSIPCPIGLLYIYIYIYIYNQAIWDNFPYHVEVKFLIMPSALLI